MPHLQALCSECGALVDATNVSDHMDTHGRLLPDDWALASWPDGTAVLINPQEEL